MTSYAAGTQDTELTSSSLVAERDGNELALASHKLDEGRFRTTLSVPGMHCGGCMSKVEKALSGLPQVERARVNLSTRRATVEWIGNAPPAMLETLSTLGFDAHPLDDSEQESDPEFRRLIQALAVAGFATANIMMVSVAVWAGADGSTRDLFHWIAAAIALPTLVYSGRIFFASAYCALRHGRTNMDVPISVGVLLAFSLSVFETIAGGAHAYFDAAITLLFVLLIGRTLDYSMREKAREAVKGLARLSPRGATTIEHDGRHLYRPVEDLSPGMTVALATGERSPVDGRVLTGKSSLDCAMVTGESEPVEIGPGLILQAGSLNLTAPLVVEVTARADASFLAEMVRLMEVAEQGRGRYRRIADRVSELYSPVVHLTALATCVGWVLTTGDWHAAVTAAIAVLIITCPCALGLAVPIVHVVAARRLFENGLLVRDGSAIERLAQVDSVVFDKTGTLTTGQPVISVHHQIEKDAAVHAAALARLSNHPLSRSLASAFGSDDSAVVFTGVEEVAGQGILGILDGKHYRLGRREWACGHLAGGDIGNGSEVVFARRGNEIARFTFSDRYREGANQALRELEQLGLSVALLSGDRELAVSNCAYDLEIQTYRAGCSPSDKVAYLDQLRTAGHKPLMVGDGLNDAPALASAHVSIAPSSAADIGRQAADIIFTHQSLEAVPVAVSLARQAGTLVRQNIGFAILYNAVAVPIAVLGSVTPLVAAVAMSASSIIVVLNAMRLAAPLSPTSRNGSTSRVSTIEAI